MTAGYLRFPHIRGDVLAFAADDDIWLCPAAGGRAWRVSAEHAPVSHPRLSRDGAWLAWTSWRDGPPEVRLTATEGGACVARTSAHSWPRRVRTGKVRNGRRRR